MSSKRILVGAGIAGLLSAVTTVSLAQESRQPEEIIVTGSYIRGATENAALPVDVIDADELEKSGAPTMLELMKSLNVSNGVLGDTNQFDSRAQGSDGAGSVNLRGLGAARTLVLLNGRRMVPNPFTDAADTNLIPMAAIKQVEILKDGAAATYGSDAIAGVVNFITDDTLDGMRVGADYRYIDGSEGDYSANVAFGERGERADFLLAVGYQHRSELGVLDRDWAHPAYTRSPEGGWSGAGNPSGYTLRAANGTDSGTLIDPSCVPLGGTPVVTASGIPVCNWQYTIFDNLTEEEDRYQVFGQTNIDIGESLVMHAEALFAHTNTPHWLSSPSYAVLQGPTPGNAQYTVPADNPGVIDFMAQNPTITTVQGTTGASADLMGGGVVLTAPLFRPFALGGNPAFDWQGASSPRTFTAHRLSAGLRGAIGATADFDVGVTYMREKGDRGTRDTVASRLQSALNGFGGPSCTGNTPGANGCLWLNPFGSAVPAGIFNGAANPYYTGAGDNDNPDLVNWMFVKTRTVATTDILVVDAVLNGELPWELPGGTIGWAAGAQYRDSGMRTDVDDLSNLALNPCVDSPDGGPSTCTAATGSMVFLGSVFETEAEGDVYGVFTELSIPLARSLQAQLAARFEDYGGRTGSTFDPKLSLRWQAFDALALRGSIGTTFRGPPINRIATGSTTTLQNIAGTFRAVDQFDNPDLQPESAQTFNLGAIVQAGSFSASLDYWSFDFENPIILEPVGGIVSALFPAGAASNCNVAAYASLQQRFTFGGDGSCTSANISRLAVHWVNGSPVKTDGFDLIAQYDWRDLFGATLSVGVNATYILNYDIDAMRVEGIQVAAAFDAVGFLNYQTTAIPLPQWKGNAFLELAGGKHNVRWTTNYVDDYVDQRRFAVNPTLGKNIDRFVTHDLSYRLELPASTNLIASIDNVLDEDPSFVRLELAYDPFTASALGRTFKVGVTKKFGGD